MNNFTKDELEYLEEAVQFHIEEDYQQNPALSVLDKIQSIIQRHCDNDDHSYDYSLGRGHCLNCDKLE